MLFITKKVVILVPVLVLTWLIVNARYAWEYRTVGMPVLIEPVLNILPLYLFILIDSVKRQEKSWLQISVQASFYVYLMSVLYLTVFFISFREGTGNIGFENLLLRLSYQSAGINLVPFTIFSDYHIFDRQIIGNLIMLSPLGLYLPLLYKKAATIRKVFLIGVLTSTFIETTQLFTSFRGADIDDIILNSIGAVLGFGFYKVVKKYLINNGSQNFSKFYSQKEIDYRFLRPKKRSKVRLFVGTIYYRCRRLLQWYFSSKTKYALEKNSQLKLQNLIASHQTPLLRKFPQSDMYLQHNKEVNLRLAVSKIDALILRPGETLSFWRLIGRPTKRKGYLDGMVLFNGTVRPGVGGGLCQLSNLIYWITLHTSLTVVERWRHSYDVFPDVDRTQPFGSGATVSYNHIDLQIKNDTDQEYLLRIEISGDYLIGRWFSSEPKPYKYEVYEKFHQITHEIWGSYVRHNVINRRVLDEEGNLIVDEKIVENHAIMMYQPLLSGAAGHNIA